MHRDVGSLLPAGMLGGCSRGPGQEPDLELAPRKKGSGKTWNPWYVVLFGENQPPVDGPGPRRRGAQGCKEVSQLPSPSLGHALPGLPPPAHVLPGLLPAQCLSPGSELQTICFLLPWRQGHVAEASGDWEAGGPQQTLLSIRPSLGSWPSPGCGPCPPHLLSPPPPQDH